MKFSRENLILLNFFIKTIKKDQYPKGKIEMYIDSKNWCSTFNRN